MGRAGDGESGRWGERGGGKQGILPPWGGSAVGAVDFSRPYCLILWARFMRTILLRPGRGRCSSDYAATEGCRELATFLSLASRLRS